MKRYITHEGVRYLIRGNYTAKELKALYLKFKEKYPTSKMSFKHWLNQGHIYLRIEKKGK